MIASEKTIPVTEVTPMPPDPARWRKSSASAYNGSCVEAAGNWRTSSASGGAGECVEAASCQCHVLVRDSTDPSGPVLTFPATTWAAFTTRLRAA